jgi:hypothetical protein
MTVRWRPEFNALTTPNSYFIRHIPRDTFGYAELAKELSEENPLWPEDQIHAILLAANEKIKQLLIRGIKVTLENAFTYTLSFTGRLNAPDDPLPDGAQNLQVRCSASPPFVEDVRNNVHFERLAAVSKQPVVAAAEDTVLDLPDVVWEDGLLRLMGNNLSFDPKQADNLCIIEGTRSGSAVQRRFGTISNSSVMLVPTLPAQTHPWNNEYLLSISTKYSENGTVRTGITHRRLRAPITIPNIAHSESLNVGILTGNANEPYVTLLSCDLSQDEDIRIQVITDALTGRLRFNLLDMQDGGRAGDVLIADGNGQLTLQGFSNSAVSGVSIVINRYAQLVRLIREQYTGRLVDILFLRMEP